MTPSIGATAQPPSFTGPTLSDVAGNVEELTEKENHPWRVSMS